MQAFVLSPFDPPNMPKLLLNTLLLRIEFCLCELYYIREYCCFCCTPFLRLPHKHAEWYDTAGRFVTYLVNRNAGTAWVPAVVDFIAVDINQLKAQSTMKLLVTRTAFVIVVSFRTHPKLT